MGRMVRDVGVVGIGPCGKGQGRLEIFHGGVRLLERVPLAAVRASVWPRRSPLRKGRGGVKQAAAQVAERRGFLLRCLPLVNTSRLKPGVAP